MIILNLTQHSATPDQIAAGVVDPPADLHAQVRAALTFTELPAAEMLRAAARTLSRLARQGADLTGGDLVMVGGPGWLMPVLAARLRLEGLEPVHAFSRRESAEEKQADGSIRKVAVFRHLGFVPHVSVPDDPEPPAPPYGEDPRLRASQLRDERIRSGD